MATIALAALAASCTALAAQKSSPRWYDVEIIVFRNVSPPGLSDELWPTGPSMPDVQDAVSLKPFRKGSQPRPFSRLPSSSDRLDGVWKALKRSSRYQPILHVAWTQPGYAPANARAVRLHGKQTIRPPAPAGSMQPAGPAAPAGQDTTPQPPPPGGTDAASTAGAVYQLDGTVKLSVVRYLHLTVDMIYSQVVNGSGLSSPAGGGSGNGAAPQAGSDQAGGAGSTPQSPGALNATPGVGPHLVRFPMRQQRRMRSGKLHYLDNPRFGILALVTPRGS